jgi:Polyketide cyclase / dehydrase and lipid transport
MAERLEVQRAVPASADEIFAVLSDPRGHVAIDSSGMLMEASGDTVTKVGDTFVVHMDREALNDYPLGLYDVAVEIVTFEPGREIAWTVRGQLNLGHVYGYRLEPIEEGTLVTSYYDWSAAEQSWKDAAIFPVIPESALRATLGILARTVAPGKPRPAATTRLAAPAAPGHCQCAGLSSAAQAGTHAAQAGAAQLALTHLWPGTSHQAARAAATAQYHGQISVATPGLSLDLG